MIREIDVASIRDAVARLLVEANYVIPPDILDALKAAVESEPSPLGRQTLEQLVRNYEVAAAERVPAESLAQTADFFWPAIGGTVPCGLYLLMVCAHHYQLEHLPEVLEGARSSRVS